MPQVPGECAKWGEAGGEAGGKQGGSTVEAWGKHAKKGEARGKNLSFFTIRMSELL